MSSREHFEFFNCGASNESFSGEEESGLCPNTDQRREAKEDMLYRNSSTS